MNAQRSATVAAAPALADPGGTPLRLQRRCACGGKTDAAEDCAECRRDELLGSGAQAFSVGPADDAWEREAERIAGEALAGGRRSAITPLPRSAPAARAQRRAIAGCATGKGDQGSIKSGPLAKWDWVSYRDHLKLGNRVFKSQVKKNGVPQTDANGQPLMAGITVGAWPWLTNNPGDITVDKKQIGQPRNAQNRAYDFGAMPRRSVNTGRVPLAVFATMDAGFAALEKMLAEPDYRHLSIRAAVDLHLGGKDNKKRMAGVDNTDTAVGRIVTKLGQLGIKASAETRLSTLAGAGQLDEAAQAFGFAEGVGNVGLTYRCTGRDTADDAKIAATVWKTYLGNVPAATPPEVSALLCCPPPAQRRVDVDGGEAAAGHTAATPYTGSGQPLPGAVRQRMQSLLGHDFSRVRVHADADAHRSARSVGAQAYTLGSHIVFAQGRFDPGSRAGEHLLAHELVHVVQQQGAAPTRVQRAGPSDAGEAPPPAPEDPATGKVMRIVIAKDDGIVVVHTGAGSHSYLLDSEQAPLGVHDAKVTLRNNGRDVEFKVEALAAQGEIFRFRYRIAAGQKNPTNLLRGQERVTIEVVPQVDIDSSQKVAGCLLPLDDQILFPRKSFKQALFPAYKKKVEWSFGTIPLGFLGFLDANAEAGVAVSGLMAAGWSDARLRDICLVKRVNKDVLEGSARLSFGVAAKPSVHAAGKVKVSADYLGVFSVVSVQGGADVKAQAEAKAALDARVVLRYDMRKSRWSFESDSRLAAEASLGINATANAAIKLVGVEVWSKRWKLLDEKLGIGWQGGLQIGSDAKPKLHFGQVGALATPGTAPSAAPSLQSASAGDPLATQSTVDDQAVVAGALAPTTGDPAHTPGGQSEDDALPFVWNKPLDIYLKHIDIPRAHSPLQLDRDDGPTPVNFDFGRTAMTMDIGVGDDNDTGQTNWPLPVRNGASRGKTFQYVDATDGDTEKDWLRETFNNRLRAPGPTLFDDGYDVDHVHEKQFGGDDKPPNLWPAELGANRAAGSLHRNQLDNYRRTEGSLAGLWFEIVDVRRP